LTPPDLAERAKWWQEARFGMFIHWGLYSIPARDAWMKHQDRLTDGEYQKYFDNFDPDLYDPAAWASAAAGAGMRYFVITTKHHDGFCLWDSALTDYKAPNTAARRDLLRPMVGAFRTQGLRVGFYHSLIDWHHPEFPIDGLHPQRDDEDFKREQQHRDVRRYAEYLHGQVGELLTQYGQVDELWMDFSYRDMAWSGKGKDDWQAEKLLAMIRELQPQILVNDRMEIGGDFVTPEQWQPAKPMERDGERVLWEACHTFNFSWGYHRDNQDWKPARMVIQMLIDCVSKDGNLLLNVGPNARGELEPLALQRLREIGEWMRLHDRSIHGCGPSRFEPPLDCRYTQRGDRLYLHIYSWPYRHLHLDNLAGKVRFAQLLNDGSEIRFQERSALTDAMSADSPEGSTWMSRALLSSRTPSRERRSTSCAPRCTRSRRRTRPGHSMASRRRSCRWRCPGSSASTTCRTWRRASSTT
jgi:alpha-L-fucosidase